MMGKLGKRFTSAKSKVDSTKKYSVAEGIQLVLDTAVTKFDESIDVSVGLGVDPKQSDQQVRGAIALPHGLGKEIRVVVFAKGPKEEEAKAAGASFVGADDLVKKIQGGWLDFDKGHCHSRYDGHGGKGRQNFRSPRAYAQSQGGNGDHECERGCGH